MLSTQHGRAHSSTTMLMQPSTAMHNAARSCLPYFSLAYPMISTGVLAVEHGRAHQHGSCSSPCGWARACSMISTAVLMQPSTAMHNATRSCLPYFSLAYPMISMGVLAIEHRRAHQHGSLFFPFWLSTGVLNDEHDCVHHPDSVPENATGPILQFYLTISLQIHLQSYISS